MKAKGEWRPIHIISDQKGSRQILQMQIAKKTIMDWGTPSPPFCGYFLKWVSKNQHVYIEEK